MRIAQAAVWLSILTVSVLSMSVLFPVAYALSRMSMHIGLAALLFYANAEWLMPRYWRREKILLYLFWLVLGFAAVVGLRYVLNAGLNKVFTIDLDREVLSSVKGSEWPRILISTGLATLGSIAYRLFLDYYLLKHEESPSESPPSITLRANQQEHRVLLEDILYVESMKEYVRVHRRSEPPLMVYVRLTELEERLGKGFLRTHRSYVVNRQHITAYNSTGLNLGETPIKISRTYKEQVLERLQGG